MTGRFEWRRGERFVPLALIVGDDTGSLLAVVIAEVAAYAGAGLRLVAGASDGGRQR